MKALRIALPPVIGLAVLFLPSGIFDLPPIFGRSGGGGTPEVTVSARELISRAEARERLGGKRAQGLDVRLVSSVGRSGLVRVRMTLPGDELAVPLEWRDSPAPTWYRWVPELGVSGVVAPAPSVHLAGASGGVRRMQRPADGRPLVDGVLIAPELPGVYALELGNAGGSQRLDGLQLIVKVPFTEQRNGQLNEYRIGRYPTEGQNRSDRYAPPPGFVEVTPENQDLKLSKNFRLKEFVTKDQHDAWPKYVVVDTLLLDKLELVMMQLEAMGVRAERMHVMSGYRTPQYNSQGVGAGRALLSRHQFGDAADVWVDNEDNGYMSDLNGDGQRDSGDARVILQAVDSVEAKFPELVGGAGVYGARPGVRGPFLHIDVRGSRSRW